MGILLEDMDGKLDVILESLSFMATKEDLRAIEDRLINVESDVKVIKAVVTGHGQDLQGHDHRIVKLEHKVFDAGA